jgi:hypothetical protein
MIDLTLSIRIPQGGRIAPVNPERDMPVIMAALEKEIRERLTQGIDAPGKILRINLAWEDIGAGEKSETEVKVPEGMLKAAMKPFGWHPDRYEAHLGAFFEGVCVRDILEAALLWQRENPTDDPKERLAVK